MSKINMYCHGYERMWSMEKGMLTKNRTFEHFFPSRKFRDDIERKKYFHERKSTCFTIQFTAEFFSNVVFIVCSWKQSRDVLGEVLFD